MMTADKLLLVFAENNLMRHGNTRSPSRHSRFHRCVRICGRLACAHGAGNRHESGHFGQRGITAFGCLFVCLYFHMDRKKDV